MHVILYYIKGIVQLTRFECFRTLSSLLLLSNKRKQGKLFLSIRINWTTSLNLVVYIHHHCVYACRYLLIRIVNRHAKAVTIPATPATTSHMVGGSSPSSLAPLPQLASSWPDGQ